MLRFVGDLEKFSTIRHFHGYYRCVAVTAAYATNDCRGGDLRSIIEEAVGKVVLRHPALCVGIVNEEGDDPVFVRLETIDLLGCVEIQVSGDGDGEDGGRGRLEGVLEYQHSQRWDDLHCRPAWKIIVIVQSSDDEEVSSSSAKVALDVVFAFHHAIADGISGLIFHNSLLEALETSNGRKNLHNHMLPIPEGVKLSPPLEKQLDFKISWSFLLGELWRYYKPAWLKSTEGRSPWTSTPCSLDHVQSFKSRVRILSIPPDQLRILLTACSKQKATITGLLHGIIVASLTTHVPAATSFRASIPYSLRHLLGESTHDEIGMFASGHSIPYSPTTIQSIRACSTDAALTDQIWTIARSFRDVITAVISRLQHDNFVGLIPYVRNLHEVFKGMIDGPRADTFEVSNIGSFKKKKNADGKWEISRIVFSQSGMGLGAAVCFNVVSVAGGEMTICVTWLEGAVDESLVEIVSRDLENGLMSVELGGGISLL